MARAPGGYAGRFSTCVLPPLHRRDPVTPPLAAGFPPCRPGGGRLTSPGGGTPGSCPREAVLNLPRSRSESLFHLSSDEQRAPVRPCFSRRKTSHAHVSPPRATDADFSP